MRNLTLIAALLCTPLAAQDSRLQEMQTGDDSRGWEGVGRLDIIGKGFCTAALISEDMILTAAHCVYDNDGALIAPDRFVFEAGLRNGRAEASRGIKRALAHPDYVHDGPSADTSEVATDIAILSLDRPIRTGRINPFPVSRKPLRGDQVGIVSYARDRAEAPSLQEVCNVLGRQNGVILMTCEIDYGSSGAPVFMMQNGAAHIVSVVSAMAEVDGARISIGTSLEAPLNMLLASFNDIPRGTTNNLTSGQRRDTGAKFVKP